MNNISLIGFMGAGKSSAGRILAERIDYSFIDTDEQIEKRTGSAVADIFKEYGEDWFRDVESDVLGEVLNGRRQVISCGGGIILRESNRHLLSERSIVVYLKARVDEIVSRVGGTGEARPLLDVDDPAALVERLLREREPLYTAAAGIVVDTNGKSVSDVVEFIIKELDTRGCRV